MDLGDFECAEESGEGGQWQLLYVDGDEFGEEIIAFIWGPELPTKEGV